MMEMILRPFFLKWHKFSCGPTATAAAMFVPVPLPKVRPRQEHGLLLAAQKPYVGLQLMLPLNISPFGSRPHQNGDLPAGLVCDKVQPGGTLSFDTTPSSPEPAGKTAPPTCAGAPPDDEAAPLPPMPSAPPGTSSTKACSLSIVPPPMPAASLHAGPATSSTSMKRSAIGSSA